MRVLLDENLPHDLIGQLPGHDVSTVQGMGWAGVQNGELLRRASGNVDVFVTMDRNLEHQQHFTDLPFGIVLVIARSNRMTDLTPLVPGILAAIAKVERGKLDRVGGTGT
ncbi:MAG TPA: DUF5615 family PIN-like protein [Vicinamibacterales bacterium]|nr:DUF5615 family PIN-like protein [Vicinamibacterales bacterium]